LGAGKSEIIEVEVEVEVEANRSPNPLRHQAITHAEGYLLQCEERW